jgi:hypothetical protein
MRIGNKETSRQEQSIAGSLGAEAGVAGSKMLLLFGELFVQ